MLFRQVVQVLFIQFLEILGEISIWGIFLGNLRPLLASHVEEDTNDKAWTSLNMDKRSKIP